MMNFGATIGGEGDNPSYYDNQVGVCFAAYRNLPHLVRAPVASAEDSSRDVPTMLNDFTWYFYEERQSHIKLLPIIPIMRWRIMMEMIAMTRNHLCTRYRNDL